MAWEPVGPDAAEEQERDLRALARREHVAEVGLRVRQLEHGEGERDGRHRVPEERGDPCGEEEAELALAQRREGWEAFTEHTWVWLLTGWISLYFLITYAPFFVLGPYLARLDYHGPRSWAIVVTGEAIGALAGAVAGLRLAPRRPMVTIGALFVVTGLQEVLG